MTSLHIFAASGVELPTAMWRIEVRTCVLWGLRDRALLPCLMALITDSRTATLTQWALSSSRPTMSDKRSATCSMRSSRS